MTQAPVIATAWLGVRDLRTASGTAIAALAAVGLAAEPAEIV